MDILITNIHLFVMEKKEQDKEIADKPELKKVFEDQERKRLEKWNPGRRNFA